MMKTILGIVALTLVAGASAFADQPTAPGSTIRVVVPAHDIQRGETIVDSDLTYADVSAARPLVGIAVKMSELDGKEARRFIHTGETVRVDDVRNPILVAKGSTVTMTFDAPGISLTGIGRATTEGGMGETVTVVNPVSFRQITGVVTGPGTVRAGAATPTGAQQIADSAKP
jgi:flagella basal body P-ring formation protein FlgA